MTDNADDIVERIAHTEDLISLLKQVKMKGEQEQAERIASALCRRLDREEKGQLPEIVKIIVSTPLLIRNDTIVSCLMWLFIDELGSEGTPPPYLDIIAKYAPTEVIQGSLKRWWIDLLSEFPYVDYFDALHAIPELHHDPEIQSAFVSDARRLSQNTDCSRVWDLEDLVPSFLQPLSGFPLIVESPAMQEVLVEFVKSIWGDEDWESILRLMIQLRGFQPLRELHDFWKEIDGFLLEYPLPFYVLDERIGLGYMRCPTPDEYRDIDDSRSAFARDLQEQEWWMMRSAILSLYDTDYSQWGELTEEDERRIEQRRRRFFELFGLQELAGYTGRLKDAFEGIEEFDGYEGLRDQLYTRLVTLSEQQIVSTGVTKGFDIDILAKTQGCQLIETIINTRRGELERAVVWIQDDCVDLRSLWNTDYGYDLLKELGLWKFCERDRLDEIKTRFREAGFELEVREGFKDRHETLTQGVAIDTQIETGTTGLEVKKGLSLLLEVGHPESVDIAMNLLRDLYTLKYSRDKGGHWFRDSGIYVSLDVIVKILKSASRRGRKHLLELLYENWDFPSSDVMSQTLNTIVEGLVKNHDKGVVEPLWNLFSQMEKIILGEGSPLYLSPGFPSLLQNVITILQEYRTTGFFENLITLWEKSLLLKHSDSIQPQLIELLSETLLNTDHVRFLVNYLLVKWNKMWFYEHEIGRLIHESGLHALPLVADIARLREKIQPDSIDEELERPREEEIDLLLERIGAVAADMNRREPFPVYGCYLLICPELGRELLASTVAGLQRLDFVSGEVASKNILPILSDIPSHPTLHAAVLETLRTTSDLIPCLGAIRQVPNLRGDSEAGKIVQERSSDIVAALEANPSLFALEVISDYPTVYENELVSTLISEVRFSDNAGEKNTVHQVLVDAFRITQDLRISNDIEWITGVLTVFRACMKKTVTHRGFIFSDGHRIHPPYRPMREEMGHYLTRFLERPILTSARPWEIIRDIKDIPSLITSERIQDSLTRNLLYPYGGGKAPSPAERIADAIREQEDPNHIVEAIEGVETLTTHPLIREAIAERGLDIF